MSCETRAGSGSAPTTSRMGLFKGKKREKTEAEQVAEDYNIIGKDKRIHPEDEEEEDEEPLIARDRRQVVKIGGGSLLTDIDNAEMMIPTSP